MNVLRRILMAALDPNYNSEQIELKRLRDRAGAAPLAKGWRRLVVGGVTTGFSHTCQCANEMKVTAPLDMFKIYRCHCGETFSLFKDAGVPRHCPPDKFEFYLLRLPVRHVGAAERRQPEPKIGTWDTDGETVQWVGSPQ